MERSCLAKNKNVHLIVRRWASAIVAHPPDDKPEKLVGQ